MRVGLNALFVLPGRVGGSEVYTRNLLRALAEQDRETRYVLFVNRSARGALRPDAPNFEEVVCPFEGDNRFARVFWEQAMLPWQCLTRRLDLLHSLGSTGPVRLPVPAVVTIHDIQYHYYPANFGAVRLRYLRWVTPLVVARAARTIAISAYTRQELINTLGAPRPEHVVTIYHGAEHLPDRAALGDCPAETCPVLRRHGVAPPYLLSLAMSFPHKNLDRLLQAFRLLLDQPEAAGLSLVMVGQAGPGHGALTGTIRREQLEARVRVTGYVPADDVPHLLRHCRFFVFPSLYEGFGFPVLEAMRQEVPVVSSNAASLPEVTGNAALLFDPTRVDAIVAAMLRCLREPGLAANLVARGREQAPKFSWAATARQTLAVYRQVAGPAAGG